MVPKPMLMSVNGSILAASVNGSQTILAIPVSGFQTMLVIMVSGSQPVLSTPVSNSQAMLAVKMVPKPCWLYCIGKWFPNHNGFNPLVTSRPYRDKVWSLTMFFKIAIVPLSVNQN
jgi:hypothetical protein